MLEDMNLPYAVMDMDGRLVWYNRMFAQLTGKEKCPHKNMSGIFQELTPAKLAETVKNGSGELLISFGERIYRMYMQCMAVNNPLGQSDIVENAEAEIQVIAVYFYDETELKAYIKKNEDKSLVVALAYLDNYEEALESVEEVRRLSFSADRADRRKISQYFANCDGIVRKLEKDKYFLVMRQSSLEKLKEQRIPYFG